MARQADNDTPLTTSIMTETYIYTIGHGNKTLEEIKAELALYDIHYLIDVRSKPYSKFYPHFNREALEREFKQTPGITYAWWGDKIGGLPPVEWNCHTDEGKVDYDKLALHPLFQSGIERLVAAHDKNFKVALMCSESDPRSCHRSKLIGRVLKERGIDVQHIMRNKLGEIYTLSQSQIFADVVNTQIDLFSETNEVHLSSKKSVTEP